VSGAEAGEATHPNLTHRQAAVLRAVVASYVGEGTPVGSQTLSHLLSVPLSAASIRNTLVELSELGLVEKAHRSAGRVPSHQGLRRFVAELLAPADLAPSERRDLAYQVDQAIGDQLVPLVSGLLSRHTRQLGFVSTPLLERVVLQHVSLVRLSSDHLLVVLVSQTGEAYRRVIGDEQPLDQPDLDRIATLLNERVAGCTLPTVRDRLARDARVQRREVDSLLLRALEIGARAVAATTDAEADLVIGTRLALLEQPEFYDTRRLRDLFEALEAKEHLVEVLDRVLEQPGVAVAIGEEIDDPSLSHCALVATSYGAGEGHEPLGVLGVIGPSRMDFRRVIPLVDYVSSLTTGKLRA